MYSEATRRDLELMQGAIDLHVHAHPDLHPRILDEIELAKEARLYGMKGFLSKSHYTITSDRMFYVNKVVKGTECYGGIVLNPAVGGINPEAVKASIRYGGKAVWMPSIFSTAHLEYLKKATGVYADMAKKVRPERGVTVLGSGGEIRPEVIEILQLVAESDIIIATSHCSVNEIRIIVDEAKNLGVKKILITHPNGLVPDIPADIQVELARKGAFLELCFLYLTPMWLNTTLDETVDIIKKAGPERCVLATDMGQVHSPSPPEGLRLFIRSLLERGVSDRDIEKMVKENPMRLLGLR